MSMPHVCRCETCGREMSTAFFGMDVSSEPSATTFWCTKHGPIETITADGCPKCKAEQSAENGSGESGKMSLKIVPIRLIRGWIFGWENQWAAVLRPSKFAWTDFTLIQIEVEHERAMDNWNATLGLLGFQLFVSYSYHEGSPQSENEHA